MIGGVAASDYTPEAAHTAWNEIVGRLAAIQKRPDSRFVIPRAEMAEVVESLPHRRFLKSHLALDGLPGLQRPDHDGEQAGQCGDADQDHQPEGPIGPQHEHADHSEAGDRAGDRCRNS
jgi:hypothetical protein